MPHYPIAFFAYNRPDHAERSIRSILSCSEARSTEIFVFIDGPRDAKSARRVIETESRLKGILGSSATFTVSERNRGCRESIVSGVSRVCSEAGAVIVIEDDLVVSEAFLRFVNDALTKLESHSEVMHVCGYMYPVREFRRLRHGLFFPFMIPWGWATWARAWRYYDPAATEAGRLEADEALRRAFDFDDARDYSGMLRNQLEGRIDAWDILWYWSMFKRGGLGYFPPVSLVKNIGFDGSGTHGFLSARLGIGRQRLAPAGAAFDIPDVRPTTGPLRDAMWAASSRLGKRGIVYRLKTLGRSLYQRA